MVKKYILGLLLIIFGTINLGVTEKYKPVASFEISHVTKDYSKLTPYIPLFQSYVDSIPTVDNFGRVRNGIIVDGIVSVLNTDPSGVDLTEIEIAYIRSIVGGMYLAGSWQKCKAVYLFVGGNSWKHKWNAKDMRDLNAAYRLTFPNGMTHSSNGIQGNGTNQYAETFFTPSANLTNNNSHLSIYSNSDISGSGFLVDISASDGSSNYFEIVFNRTTLSHYTAQYSTGTVPFATTDGKGYTLGSRTSSNRLMFLNKDRFILNTGTETQILPSTTTVSIGCRNNSTSRNLFSNRAYQFSSMGAGLTDQQSIQTSNIVTYSQGILNRQ